MQSAFFGVYAAGSLIHYLVSITSGNPISRIGYKNVVVIGLFITAFGSGLFVPAATLNSYVSFLVACFIVRLGRPQSKEGQMRFIAPRCPLRNLVTQIWASISSSC